MVSINGLCKPRVYVVQEAAEIARGCRPSTPPGQWQPEDVNSMGCAFTALGSTELDQVSEQAMCGALEGELGECDQQDNVRRSFVSS